MYREHFGLEALPFKITPDPAFLCQTSQNRRALNLLRSDVAKQYPINVITGDIGTGKTTLILQILGEMADSTTLGLLSNCPNWAEDILPWVLYAFDLPNASDEVLRLEAFENFVRAEHAAGRKCVLIVDEAQNVSQQGLEQLRRLVNVNSGKEIMLAVILVGQNELHQKLKGAGCEAITHRIGVSVSLAPMTLAETDSYVRHRLAVAGGNPEVFDREAIRAVHVISGGYPRLVNIVCDTAMVLAYGAGTHRVDKDTIQSLGEEDSVLLHLPDIAERTNAARRNEPTSEAVFSDSTPQLQNAHLERDVFEFVPRSASKLISESEVPPSPKDPPPVDDSADTGPTIDKGNPFGPTVGSSDIHEPGSELPSRTKLAEGRRPESAVGHSKKTETPAAAEPALQHERLGPGTRFGGVVAASVVAVGVYFIWPVALPELPSSQAPEIVSKQSVSQLTPAALVVSDPEGVHAPVRLSDNSGEAFLERALSAGVTDPATAAIDYARAALRGEALAAYYLGQLYETGDGVPRDLALARSWYASVQDSVRGARRRLGDLGAPLVDGELAAPTPLLGGHLDSGGAEFVWSSGHGPDPEFFVVELSNGPADSIRRLDPLETSALKIESIDEVHYWRVLAVAPGLHRYSASEWTPLGSSGGALPDSADVEPHAVVQVPVGMAPERVALVTGLLDASGVSYTVTQDTSDAIRDSGLQVGYFYENDESSARTFADAVGAEAIDFVSDADSSKRSAPLPGQIFIRLSER